MPNPVPVDQSSNPPKNNAAADPVAPLPTQPQGTLLDTLLLGNKTSEQQHDWKSDLGQAANIIAGESLRRLLPRAPASDYGGEMSFKMAVDPLAQNYFTAKIWGSDKSASRLILRCEDREVGARFGGQDGEVFWESGGGWFSNRFIYRTAPLPLSLTHGKKEVTITLRSTGPIAPLATEDYEHFQKKMTQPTAGICRVYTHLSHAPNFSDDPQGAAPKIKTPVPAISDGPIFTRWKTDVNDRINHLLAGDPAKLSVDDVDYLAQCYEVKWSAAYHKPEIVDRVIQGIDSLVAAYSLDDRHAGTRWGGAYGPAGDAIRLLYPHLPTRLDAQVNYGGLFGLMSRGRAWAIALRASIDVGRTNRPSSTSLAMIDAWNIYLANRGLLLLNPGAALQETEALRYLRESMGLAPWRGNDLPGNDLTPKPGDSPYGPDWYMVTSKGLTKEGAFVGGDFGELGPFAMLMAQTSGDAQLQAQALKMCRARAPFRFPAEDAQGYRVMQVAAPIGCRDDKLPGYICYLGRSFYDDFQLAALGPEVIGKDLAGYFQQQMADGQLLPLLEGGASNDPGAPYLPERYAAIKALPKTGVKLPMTNGQPDFAWADEENMVVAAKHGEERFWATLNWRDTTAINGLSKVFCLTPQTAQLAEVQIDDVQFKPSGEVETRGPQVVPSNLAQLAPPDQPINANEGLRLPVALRPDLAQAPAKNRDGGRGYAYTLRYGHWLVMMNAHPSQNYTAPLPTGIAEAKDLVSGQIKSGSVTLMPKSSAVFYVDAAEALPNPSAPPTLNTQSGSQKTPP